MIKIENRSDLEKAPINSLVEVVTQMEHEAGIRTKQSCGGALEQKGSDGFFMITPVITGKGSAGLKLGRAQYSFSSDGSEVYEIKVEIPDGLETDSRYDGWKKVLIGTPES